MNPGWGTGGNGVYDQDMVSIVLSKRPYTNNSTFTWVIPEKWDYSNNFGGNSGGGTQASGIVGQITTATQTGVIAVSRGNASMTVSKYTDVAQQTSSQVSNTP